MRIHDIKLMKLLLNINVTIQKMTNERLGQSLRLASQSSRRGSTKRQSSAPPSMWLQRDILSSSSTDGNSPMHNDMRLVFKTYECLRVIFAIQIQSSMYIKPTQWKLKMWPL